MAQDQQKTVVAMDHEREISCFSSTSEDALKPQDQLITEANLRRMPSLLHILFVLLFGIGSFATCAGGLQALPSLGFRIFLSGDAENSSQAGVLIFASSLALFICSLICQVDKEKKIRALLVIFINVIALSTYMLLNKNATPALRDHFGRRSYPIRYLQWLHTTPTLVYLVAHLSIHPSRKMIPTIVCTVVMLTGGCLATFSTRFMIMLAAMSLSTCAFVVVLTFLWQMLREAAHEAQNWSRLRIVWYLRCHLLLSWTSFPAVWFLSATFVISPRTEGMMYLFADFSAKVIFSSLLLEGNFSSIEEKLTSAKALSDQNAKNAMIEELLESQRELRKAKALAEKAYEEKSRFFSNASHEIRTPMNGVIGLSELLMSTELSLTQRAYVETIKSSGNFLLNLINDILFAAKMEAEDVNLEVVTFSLRELVQESLFIFEPGAREKGITLAHEFGDDVPDLVSGAPTRLRQVLTNLVSNALRFTDEGRIDICVHVDRSGLAGGSEELPDGGPIRLQFEVRDTGLGIPESVRDKIFEAFIQANDMEALRRGGTGLGLSICRSLVYRMGGKIWLESQVGRGTSLFFTTVLKLAPQSSEDVSRRSLRSRSSLDEDAASPLTSLEGLHILIAEDNKVNQMVITGILKNLNCTFEVVDDGRKAVEACREGRFDVIFMDCQMPNMDGFEATRRIRMQEKEHAGRRHEIVALTASALDEDRERCSECGMDGFLTKPVRSKDVQKTLKKVLSR